MQGKITVSSEEMIRLVQEALSARFPGIVIEDVRRSYNEWEVEFKMLPDTRYDLEPEPQPIVEPPHRDPNPDEHQPLGDLEF